MPCPWQDTPASTCDSCPEIFTLCNQKAPVNSTELLRRSYSAEFLAYHAVDKKMLHYRKCLTEITDTHLDELFDFLTTRNEDSACIVFYAQFTDLHIHSLVLEHCCGLPNLFKVMASCPGSVASIWSPTYLPSIIRGSYMTI